MEHVTNRTEFLHHLYQFVDTPRGLHRNPFDHLSRLGELQHWLQPRYQSQDDTGVGHRKESASALTGSFIPLFLHNFMAGAIVVSIYNPPFIEFTR